MTDSRREQMIKELQSDMADLVEAGEMTPNEANEWVNHKSDQWALEATPDLGRVTSTCIEHAYGTTFRLSFQIKVF
jgi:hypothetical protein